MISFGGQVTADDYVAARKLHMQERGLFILLIAAVQLFVRLFYLPRRVRSVYSQLTGRLGPPV